MLVISKWLFQKQSIMLSDKLHDTTSWHQLNAALFDIHGFRLSDPPVNNSAFLALGIPALRHCGSNFVWHSGL